MDIGIQFLGKKMKTNYLGFKFRSSSYLHQGFFSQIPQVGRVLRSPALIGDCLRGDVALLQKCCYKWQPWKCLGLDVTNLIIYIYIYIYINGSKNPRSHNFFLFNYFFGQVVKIRPKRKEKTLNFTCAWFLELFVTSSRGAF